MSSKLKWIFSVVGAVAALIAIVTTLVTVINHVRTSSSSFKRHNEEKMVARLAPGHEFGQLAQFIGAQPDRKITLTSGGKIYQYERQWEDIQLLVGADDQVLSVGIYGKDSSFHPVISTGDSSPITLGETHFQNALSNEDPGRVNAYCGLHTFGYFEAYEDRSIAVGGGSVVVGLSSDVSPFVGLSSTDTFAYDLSGICLLVANSRCSRPDLADHNDLSPDYAQCLLATPQGKQFRRNSVISMVLITQRSQKVTTDMLHPPDEVAGLIATPSKPSQSRSS
jgi:hypothetical protein